MARFLRILQTAVDPADVRVVRDLFDEDIVPAFAVLEGCLGIELVMSVEHNAGGLVEGCAISRWESRESMDSGVASRGARESQVRIIELLRQEPVIRVFEVLCPT
ncbi:MAG: antibiotic biosynthesis monooxygenase family protein [Acidimicrobiales bacterium]